MHNCIVTTSWDDGQLLDDKLSSLLLDYDIPGTFYIPKTFEGVATDPNLAKKLSRNFEIGAHSLSHNSLTNVDLASAFEEIKGSKEWLEQLLNQEIDMFAYPKGRHNAEIISLVKRAGFKGARSLHFQTVPQANFFTLGVGPQASNGSPLLRIKASLNSKFSIQSLTDWSVNAKILFDHILEKGGIWHLWGHSWEIEKNNDWNKLKDVLAYVSGRKNTSYLENRQVISALSE